MNKQYVGKRCNKQYVGQTNQQVSKRMNSHRFDINNYDSEGYATNVALHFNSDSHSIADFSFLPIDVVIESAVTSCLFIESAVVKFKKKIINLTAQSSVKTDKFLEK